MQQTTTKDTTERVIAPPAADEALQRWKLGHRVLHFQLEGMLHLLNLSRRFRARRDIVHSREV